MFGRWGGETGLLCEPVTPNAGPLCSRPHTKFNEDSPTPPHRP
jgi:hypothetical protein